LDRNFCPKEDKKEKRVIQLITKKLKGNNMRETNSKFQTIKQEKKNYNRKERRVAVGMRYVNGGATKRVFPFSTIFSVPGGSL